MHSGSPRREPSRIEMIADLVLLGNRVGMTQVLVDGSETGGGAWGAETNAVRVPGMRPERRGPAAGPSPPIAELSPADLAEQELAR
jgi:hypothetical protein